MIVVVLHNILYGVNNFTGFCEPSYENVIPPVFTHNILGLPFFIWHQYCVISLPFMHDIKQSVESKQCVQVLAIMIVDEIVSWCTRYTMFTHSRDWWWVLSQEYISVPAWSLRSMHLLYMLAVLHALCMVSVTCFNSLQSTSHGNVHSKDEQHMLIIIIFKDSQQRGPSGHKKTML